MQTKLASTFNPSKDISAYIEGEAKGAMKNGTLVRKINGEEGDFVPDGTVGVVISSLDAQDEATGGVEAAAYALEMDFKYMYFVVWETNLELAVGIVDKKIEKFFASPDPED